MRAVENFPDLKKIKMSHCNFWVHLLCKIWQNHYFFGRQFLQKQSHVGRHSSVEYCRVYSMAAFRHQKRIKIIHLIERFLDFLNFLRFVWSGAMQPFYIAFPPKFSLCIWSHCRRFRVEFKCEFNNQKIYFNLKWQKHLKEGRNKVGLFMSSTCTEGPGSLMKPVAVKMKWDVALTKAWKHKNWVTIHEAGERFNLWH